MSHCTNCGAEVRPGVGKCAYCGAAVAVIGAQQAPRAPTPPAAPPASPVPMGDQKSKVAAGVLGILLGCLGIHNFYLGYTTKGIIQVAITVLTLGAGAFISGIWGLVEGIMILTGSIATDAAGRPLKD
jgi:TM2 domain-containing membrane protein YozV